MKRRVEALSCYNKPCEEYCGVADSWYVLSIVKLSVKVQPKQVQGDISFFIPGFLPVLPSTASIQRPSRKSQAVFIATSSQPHHLMAIRHTLLPLLGLAMVFRQAVLPAEVLPTAPRRTFALRIATYEGFLSVCCACSCRFLLLCQRSVNNGFNSASSSCSEAISHDPTASRNVARATEPGLCSATQCMRLRLCGCAVQSALSW